MASKASQVLAVAATTTAAIGGGALLLRWLRRRWLIESIPYKENEYGIGKHETKRGGFAQIRLATSADADTILRLVQALAVYEDKPLSTVELSAADFRRDLLAGKFICLLADLDDNFGVGLALSYPSYSTWQGSCIYLEDLYVDEPFRKHGLGSLLIKSVAALAHARGSARLHWNALDWNTPALDFYKACGASRLNEWVTLRMERPQISKFLFG